MRSEKRLRQSDQLPEEIEIDFGKSQSLGIRGLFDCHQEPLKSSPPAYRHTRQAQADHRLTSQLSSLPGHAQHCSLEKMELVRAGLPSLLHSTSDRKLESRFSGPQLHRHRSPHFYPEMTCLIDEPKPR